MNDIERAKKTCDKITDLILKKSQELTWKQANEAAKKIYLKTLSAMKDYFLTDRKDDKKYE